MLSWISDTFNRVSDIQRGEAELDINLRGWIYRIYNETSTNKYVILRNNKNKTLPY